MATIHAGCIKTIFENPEGELPPNPIVQVISIRPILQKEGPPRIRLIVSDGISYMNAMLSTQMSDLVDTDKLKKYSIIRLANYIRNVVSKRRVIIALGIEILSNSAAKIGNPVSVEPETEAPPAPQSVVAAVPKPVQQQSAAAAMPKPVHQPAAGYRNQAPQQEPQQRPEFGNPAAPRANSYGGWNSGNDTSSSLAQRSMSDLSANIFPIKSLNPYQNKWIIKARVTQKSDIRHWSNSRSEGRLFSVNLLDETGEIKATIFQDQVDKFFELLEEKKVYYITKAKVGIARKQYSTLTNDYELTFEAGTEITPCFDDDLPAVRYNFVQLSELGNIEKDVIVDVIGVVINDHGLSNIVSKKLGKELKKRDLQIVDQSLYAVKLTLWDRFAEMFTTLTDSIVAFKAVKVSDYNGRSLSLVPSGMVVVDPDTPEGIKLRGWYDSVGRTENFLTHSGLSASSFGFGGSSVSNVRKTLSQVKEEGLGMGDKDFFTTKGTVIFFKQENFSYPACKDCKKKVFEENNSWRCEKCQKTWPEADYRYIMSLNVSDPTGAIWMSAFDEVGEKLLGQPAGTMMALKENNDDERFRAVFSEANFKSYIFKCRAKNETFNDTNRMRYSITSIEPIDIIKESNELVALIEQYERL